MKTFHVVVKSRGKVVHEEIVNSDSGQMVRIMEHFAKRHGASIHMLNITVDDDE